MPSETSFWSSLPGILTGVATVIGAIGSIIVAVYAARAKEPKKERPTRSRPRQATAPEPSAPQPEPAVARAPATRQLRSAPAVLTSAKVDAMLMTGGLYDKRRNAAAAGVDHDYEAEAVANGIIVHDRGTGLVWQRGGSENGLTLSETEAYVDRLNLDRYAGFRDWRIPTLEEAMSLMQPEAQDGYHLSPAFRRDVAIMWSADRTEDGRGWAVYFADGIASAERATFHAGVRAVR